MTTAHTPGPWDTHQDGIRAANGEIIATLHAVEGDMGKYYGRGESDANARLIAEAPAMRDLLQWALDHLTAEEERRGWPGDEANGHGKRQEIRALLARIDGTEATR